MGEYTKLNTVRGTTVHRDIVRHQLTKKLGKRTSTTPSANESRVTNNISDILLPQMKEEADLALGNILSECNSKGIENT